MFISGSQEIENIKIKNIDKNHKKNITILYFFKYLKTKSKPKFIINK